MTLTDLTQNLTLCFARGSGSAAARPIIATSSKPAHIPKNHILICVDRFGFSANNITYQALGEHPLFRYFDFHAPPNDHERGISSSTHGVVPVWGFGTVIGSSLPKVEVGERLYGYLAPTRYVLVEIDPNDVNKHAIYVPRAHLPPDRRPYNQITRCSSDPVYTKETEDLIMLYRPLFWTSFWCEDWLYTSGYYGNDNDAAPGAVTMLISSASSKTAFCFAYCVRKRAEAEAEATTSRKSNSKPKPTSTTTPTLIGITSSKNLAFTKRLGLYDQVYSYDEFTSVPALNINNNRGKEARTGTSRWIYIDVAGNDKLNDKVYKHFESPYTGTLVMSVSLGMTTLTPATATATASMSTGKEDKDKDRASALISSSSGNVMSVGVGVSSNPNPSKSLYPKLEKFFTPEWLEIRRKQIPLQEIFAMQKRAWEGLMRDCKGWVEMERVYDGSGLTQTHKIQQEYTKIAKEGMAPDKGMVWSMWGGEEDVERVCRGDLSGTTTRAKL